MPPLALSPAKYELTADSISGVLPNEGLFEPANVPSSITRIGDPATERRAVNRLELHHVSGPSSVEPGLYRRAPYPRMTAPHFLARGSRDDDCTHGGELCTIPGKKLMLPPLYRLERCAKLRAPRAVRDRTVVRRLTPATPATRVMRSPRDPARLA